jgi:hypothetical protein
MNQKMKKDQDNFVWTASELKTSKKIDSLPKALQEKLSSRNAKAILSKQKQS